MFMGTESLKVGWASTWFWNVAVLGFPTLTPNENTRKTPAGNGLVSIGGAVPTKA